MAAITDKGMQARPTAAGQWLTQAFMRGCGVFVGRITPTGERLFYFRYTDSNGNRPFLPIGPYHPKGSDGLTLAQAYDKAAELSTLYRSGIKDLREHFAQAEADRLGAEQLQRQCLADEQRQREDDARTAELVQQRRMTVRQAFDRWRTTDLQPALRADGTRNGRKDGGLFVFQQFTRHVFPLIGDTALEDLRKADLLAVIDAQKGKTRTAAMLLGDLKQMLGFALDRDLIGADPLANVKKARIVGTPVERDRTLSDEEIRLMVPAIVSARMHPRNATAIWLTLATGVRVGELMGAVWGDDLPADPKLRKARLDALLALAEAEDVKLGIIDTAARTWHLPTTKNQRDHTIHLSDFALARLEVLRQHREVLTPSTTGELSPWVFPATENSRPVCVKSFGKQLADRQRTPEERMTNRTKAVTSLSMPGGRWTAHDLRRTAATLMARRGFASDTINECLNHIQADRMARVYIQDRREADQIRAFDALGARLQELVSGQQIASNVITLAAAA
jgi:integrase